MDPLPISSYWFLSFLFQSLVTFSFSSLPFPTNPRKLRIRILKLKLSKKNSAQIVTTIILFLVYDFFLYLFPYNRSTGWSRVVMAHCVWLSQMTTPLPSSLHLHLHISTSISILVFSGFSAILINQVTRIVVDICRCRCREEGRGWSFDSVKYNEP